MSLSFTKFEQFLHAHSFSIGRVFIGSSTYLVECIAMDTIIAICVSIPKTFDFDISQFKNIVKLAPIKMNVGTNEVDNFILPSDGFISDNYANTDTYVGLPSHNHKEPMGTHLEQLYKHTIVKGDLQKENNIILHSIHRQLNRLKYCIQGMQHKLACARGQFVQVLGENDIQVYSAQTNITPNSKFELFVVVEFTTMWDKIDLITKESSDIINGIYKILNMTQNTHVKNISMLVKRYDSIIVHSEFLIALKSQYTDHIERYTELLQDVLKKELDARVVLIQDREVKTTSLAQEMRKTHRVTISEKKLSKILKTKNELVESLVDLRLNANTTFLEIDTILFDNIVLMDKVLDNFNRLDIIKDDLDK